jgi:hypothetical protein
MRRRAATALILCASAFAITSAASQAPAISAQARAELFAARDAIWRGWFANDRVVLERMLPEDFVGIGFGGGPFDTRASALQGAADFAAGGGKLVRLEFADDRIQQFGDVATVFSNYTLEFEINGTRTTQVGRATELFLRRGGRWINPAWHLDSGK